MAKIYDNIIYIGRFQPLHNAHVKIIEYAATLANRVIVIVGSAFQPRTFKNPFTSEERMDLINHLKDSIDAELIVERTYDTIYNDNAWAVRIQDIVKKHNCLNVSTAIIGHDKDETTYYLNMFPQWKLIDVPLLEQLNATSIRSLYFSKNLNLNFVKSVIPDHVHQFLDCFKNTKEYSDILEEQTFIETYKSQYSGLQYKPYFITTDCCVVQSGHVLLVRRKALPGKDLMALPGGFLDQNESLIDSAIRELKEETNIKVPVPALKGNIVQTHVFDHPKRSFRGRTVTHAYHIQLPDGKLPKIKGGDDASDARWIPFCQLNPEYMFEDHWEIINYFIGA
jgi:bifunctional NMN adenylyltransferase/nudix hydrolase